MIVQVIANSGGADLGTATALDTFCFIDFIAGADKLNRLYRALLEAIVAAGTPRSNMIMHILTLLYLDWLQIS